MLHNSRGFERCAQAAALAVLGTTAFTALCDKVQLQRGERVLVRGAAGGVGAAAVKLARVMGAHVTGLTSARDADYVRSPGAETVLNYGRLVQRICLSST